LIKKKGEIPQKAGPRGRSKGLEVGKTKEVTKPTPKNLMGKIGEEGQSLILVRLFYIEGKEKGV